MSFSKLCRRIAEAFSTGGRLRRLLIKLCGLLIAALLAVGGLLGRRKRATDRAAALSSLGDDDTLLGNNRRRCGVASHCRSRADIYARPVPRLLSAGDDATWSTRPADQFTGRR